MPSGARALDTEVQTEARCCFSLPHGIEAAPLRDAIAHWRGILFAAPRIEIEEQPAVLSILYYAPDAGMEMRRRTALRHYLVPFLL
jgi:hypothetical protein